VILRALCGEESTQIRKHIPAILIIPHAGTLKGIKFSRGKRRSRDRQGNGLIESLLAGEAYPSFMRLVDMFVAITASTLYTSPQRWILTTMWYEIPDDHLTLFSHVHLIMKP
jgi:hypothetical protein